MKKDQIFTYKNALKAEKELYDMLFKYHEQTVPAELKKVVTGYFQKSEDNLRHYDPKV